MQMKRDIDSQFDICSTETQGLKGSHDNTNRKILELIRTTDELKKEMGNKVSRSKYDSLVSMSDKFVTHFDLDPIKSKLEDKADKREISQVKD